MKPHLVWSAQSVRPLAALTRAEKLAQAIAWLRSRGKYLLDAGAPKPKWGVPGEPPKVRTKIGGDK